MSKPILVLDFDGVISGYQSGWVEPDFLPDPPVPGSMEFLYEAIQHFDVKVFSSRSRYDTGLRAMRTYIRYWAKRQLSNQEPDYKANAVINAIVRNEEAFPTEKPPAFLTIDDRALTFTGIWPSVETLKAFKPWNKS